MEFQNAAALFNSFVFDWLVRQRLGAAALAWYVVAESALRMSTPCQDCYYRSSRG